MVGIVAITELNKQTPRSKSLNSVPRSLLLSSAFIQTPLAPPFSRPSSSKPNLVPFVPENKRLREDYEIFPAFKSQFCGGFARRFSGRGRGCQWNPKFLKHYNTLLIVRLVLTWFPNSPPAIVSPLSTLCDPYLNIFRGIIPPLGGTLDLSPILAFIVLNAFTSTAAALPAELPVAGQHPRRALSHSLFTALTSSQKKWMRRLNQSRSKNSESNADN
ncbi:P-type ATPase of 2 isoform 1 [Hibiscus syriacus]|uniref:P-type ATPase of 2 isoform 1 n=1 Tax=Hibiscus syriacus TaxID=106335 RepID=A0A6A3B5W1_HIBSY|nr:P-type ATPase of 2 isoform 1 [Hibiscus syriacus]